jgi:uncharacterized protein DUF6174
MARRRSWLWFFGVIVILGAVAVVAPLVHNLRMQLTPAQLAEAEERWRLNGPADYDLDFSERLNEDAEGDRLLIRVREGNVVAVLRDGKPLSTDELPASERQLYSVPGLFKQIAGRLEEDRAAGKRNYATAYFDNTTGYPVRYVHRDRGTRHRLEWIVRLLAPG